MKSFARIAAVLVAVCMVGFVTDEAEAGRRRRVIRTPDGRVYVVVQSDSTSERLPRYTASVPLKSFDPATTRDQASTTLQWRGRLR